MKKLSDKFADVRVLIVGDVMLDQYWWGNVERVSPEAPVPVVNLKRKTLIPGGAANVAANIAGLGAKAYLIGVLGEDQEGLDLTRILSERRISADYLIKNSRRPTIVKTRIIAQNQQIVRVDQEDIGDICDREEESVVEKFTSLIENVNVVILSDYAKGLITETIALRLITTANASNKMILVDPKGRNYNKYKNATILTPNKKEVYEAIGTDLENYDDLETAGKYLMGNYGFENLLITRGEQGMTLFQKEEKPRNLKATARQVYDVTGAGDTVIATLAVAVAAGKNFLEAAGLANTAAGLVVEEVGTTAININDLELIATD